jgi:hypothetical protein
VKRTTWALGALLLVSATAAYAEARWETTELSIVRVRDVDLSPTVDGDLRDMGWTKAQEIGVKPDEDAGRGFEFSIASSDGRLYLSCETRVESPKQDARDRDSEEVLADDAFEVVLDGGPTLVYGARILVTPRGTVYDEMVRSGEPKGDPAVNYAVEAASRVKGQTWTMELAIPWSEIGLTGDGSELAAIGIRLLRAGQPVASFGSGRDVGNGLLGLPLAAHGLRSSTDDLDTRDVTVAPDGDQLALSLRAHNSQSHAANYRIVAQVLAPPSPSQRQERMVFATARESSPITFALTAAGDASSVLVLLYGYDDNLANPHSVAFSAYAARLVDE